MGCEKCFHNYHCSMPQEGYDFDPDTCPYNHPEKPANLSAEPTKYEYTKVWEINGQLVVSKNIEEAIQLYKEYAGIVDITEIRAIYGGMNSDNNRLLAITKKNG